MNDDFDSLQADLEKKFDELFSESFGDDDEAIAMIPDYDDDDTKQVFLEEPRSDYEDFVGPGYTLDREVKGRESVLDYDMISGEIESLEENHDELIARVICDEDDGKNVYIVFIVKNSFAPENLTVGEHINVYGKFGKKTLFDEQLMLGELVFPDEIDQKLEDNGFFARGLKYFNWIFNSTKGQKNLLMRKLGDPISKDEDLKTDSFSTLPDLEKLYDLTKDSYSPKQRAIIERLLKDLNSGKDTTNKLYYILNISSTCPGGKNPSYSELMDFFETRLYRMDKVKKHIAEYLTTRQATNDKSLKLLLVGNPGTGKTSIARAISEAYNLPYDLLSLASVNSPVDLKGTNSSYKSAEPGMIVQAFSRLNTTECVLVLDEIDKMAETNEGNPYTVLLDILSENFCYDEYLNFPISTPNTIYIATANSIEDLPQTFLDRFEIIHVDDYSDETKFEIAKKISIPQYLDTLENKEFKERIKFTDEAIKTIIRDYCDDFGMRRFSSNLKIIVREIIASTEEAGLDKNLENSPILVTPDLIENYLKGVVDPNSPIIKFKRGMDKLSKQTVNLVHSLINKLNGNNISQTDKEVMKKQLDYLTSTIPFDLEPIDFNEKDFYTKLNKSHYGMQEVKNDIAKIFYLSKEKGKPINNERILLSGAAGTGKSSICSSIANALDIPIIKISLNGVNDESFIKGVSPGYSNSDAGIIIRELSKLDSMRCIIWLDEIDKLDESGRKISNALLDLLDDSKTFLDVFLGVPVDLSNILFIATANDLIKVNPLIRDRFSIIQLKGYTLAEKEMIAKDYIVPSIAEEYDNLEIKISPSICKLIVQDYCPSLGLRDLKRALNAIVKDKVYLKGIKNNSLSITREDVFRTLGKKQTLTGNFPLYNHPGLSKGLGVSGNIGLTMAIETLILPNEGLTITGLPEDAVYESVQVALSYIQGNYKNELKNRGLHVHFGEGSVPKDGTSAGVAIFMSLFSAIYKMEVPIDNAFTGEIDLFGGIYQVDGLTEKIQAAINDGCSRVFVPKSNYDLFSKKYIKNFEKEIELIPVSHISEVLQKVLPESFKYKNE